MKFKTDENLPLEAATTLREAGFDAETVRDESLSSAADQIIASRVQTEERVLITLDLDFANIQAYPPGLYAGIIVLRPRFRIRRLLWQTSGNSWQSSIIAVRTVSCGLCNATGFGSGNPGERLKTFAKGIMI